jgi:tetratricopeptide (TPR) repeat protein
MLVCSMLFLASDYSQLDWSYVLNRILDTLLGIGAVLVVSYLFWPVNRLAEIRSLDTQLRTTTRERLLAIRQWLKTNHEGPVTAPVAITGSRLAQQLSQLVAAAFEFTVVEAAELVKKMRDGASDKQAVAEVSGLPWERFEPAWRAYIRGKGYRPMDADFQTRLLFKGKDTEADELAAIKIDKARDHVWLGDRMRLRDRWQAAVKQYRKATTHVGDKSPLVQGKLGLALLKTKRYEEAASELQKPLVDSPRHVVLHVYLGQALMRLGRYQEARVHLEEALTINPFDPDVHETLAEVYTQLGEHEKAEIERRHHKLIHD